MTRTSFRTTVLLHLEYKPTRWSGRHYLPSLRSRPMHQDSRPNIISHSKLYRRLQHRLRREPQIQSPRYPRTTPLACGIHKRLLAVSLGTRVILVKYIHAYTGRHIHVSIPDIMWNSCRDFLFMVSTEAAVVPQSFEQFVVCTAVSPDVSAWSQSVLRTPGTGRPLLPPEEVGCEAERQRQSECSMDSSSGYGEEEAGRYRVVCPRDREHPRLTSALPPL